MNKVVISLLIFILITTGVGIYFNQDRVIVEEKSNNNKMSDTEIFEKKKECASYKQQAEEKYKKMDQYNDWIVTKIFFSPLKNTCLLEIMPTRLPQGEHRFVIEDYFGDSIRNGVTIYQLYFKENDQSFNELMNNGGNTTSDLDIYEAKLKKLKGE